MALPSARLFRSFTGLGVARPRFTCFSRSLCAKSVEPHLAQKPTLEEADAMPREYYEMCNQSLLQLSAEGNYGAREERLIREIMSKDRVSWDDAQPILDGIKSENLSGVGMLTLPYKVSAFCAYAMGFASFPLCFHMASVKWFNSNYVTFDVPDPKDLETMLEVGSWAWNWMEPPLGQLSFFLLCLQFARTQMLNMGVMPYSAWIIQHRSSRLSARFSQYNQTIVEEFAETHLGLGDAGL